jgi:beta-ribofuranosylaminobenzene 5'-phosphate synthase
MIVRVATPSRLHFGLLRLHTTCSLGHGGLGLMIDSPGVELELSAAVAWDIAGPSARRAAMFAQQALASVQSPDAPTALRIRIHATIPPHRGLGGGTQLGLAVAAGVCRLAGIESPTAADLAAAVGRGERSAVGSHGFVHGGLIWERGIGGASGLSELTARVALPAEWRVLLIAPSQQQGRSGLAERRAFAELPPVLPHVSHGLEEIAEREILPAVRNCDFTNFSEAVFQYGRLAGECFGPVQGGPYASTEVAAVVDHLRARGIHGVGQSSWGPTVFAFMRNELEAAAAADDFRRSALGAGCDVRVAAPCNRGALVSADDVPVKNRGKSTAARTP